MSLPLDNRRRRLPLFARYPIESLTAAVTLLILLFGLVPFDVRVAGTGTRVLLTTATNHVTLPDAISNVALYVPVGLLFVATLRRARTPALPALVLATIAAGVFSATVEWAQSYMGSRVSSLIDLCANISGAALGAGVGVVAGQLVPRFVGAALFEFRYRPAAMLAKLYALGLLIVGLMPFTFAVDGPRLKQVAQEARWVPFAEPSAHAPTSGDPEYWRQREEMAGMKRWSRWGAEAISFAALAWLLWPVFRRDYGFSPGGSWRLTLWAGLGLATLISFLQFFVIARGLDVTDALFRGIGLIGGAASRRWLAHDISPRQRARLEHIANRTACGGCVLVLVFIIYNGLIPFEFGNRPGGPAAAVFSKSMIPFVAYSRTTFDLMMNDLLDKLLAWTLFAFFLSIAWRRVALRDTSNRLVTVAAVAIALSACIEFVQIFTWVRVPSLTDPILAGMGSVVGVLARDHAVAFYRFAARHEQEGPSMPKRRHFSSLDELIATLGEPYADAPAETAPHRRPAAPRDSS